MEILTYTQRQKPDETNDKEFYSTPKFVYHLDSNFRNNLSAVYKKEIQNHSSVLDLMSSWDSYLPKEIKYKKVIGHGLNEEELKKNKAFDSFWIQNLNKTQNMPIEDSTIDVGLIVAGWQYLQYPEKVSLELSRIIKPDSLLIKKTILPS